MAQVTYSKQYSDAIQAIKQAILQSRYTAARLINREMLALYYAVGEYISFNSRTYRNNYTKKCPDCEDSLSPV